MIKVNFVCHGNICRSPMAEFILKKMAKDRGIDISVSSSATSYEEIGNDIHPGTKRVLTAHSIPFSKRGATHFEKEDYKNNDYILCMDSYNIKNLKRIIGSDPENKVHLLLEYGKNTRDISDPWYTGNFDLSYQRALSLYRYFQINRHLDLKRQNCEVLVCGSGTEGALRAYPDNASNTKNQRFLIHILPKPGVIN